MHTRSSALTASIAAAILFGTAATALGQTSAQQPDPHHPEAGTAPGTAATAPAPQPGSGPGMMGPGMMDMMRGMMGPGMMGGGPAGGGGGGMAGMMDAGMMGHGMMMHPGVMLLQPGVIVLTPPVPMMPGMMGMRSGMMGGPAMMAPGTAEPGTEESPMMMPPGMMRQGMMGPGTAREGHGIGPALLYGVPPQEWSAERVGSMIEGLLAWHGNPRLKLGEVREAEDGGIVAEIVTADDSLVQRLAFDRRTGAIRQMP